MTLRNLARFGLALLFLTGLVAGGVHARTETHRAATAGSIVAAS